jgi:hypothetical protein
MSSAQEQPVFIFNVPPQKVHKPGNINRLPGFWCFLFSNVLWVIWGRHVQACAVVVMQIVLTFLNMCGAWKNEAASGTQAAISAMYCTLFITRDPAATNPFRVGEHCTNRTGISRITVTNQRLP